MVKLPNINEKCGKTLKYNDFITCCDTYKKNTVNNIPRQIETYNAIKQLIINVLDPIIEHFGAIQITYGFASSELTKYIHYQIAPKLDQHAGHELNTRGSIICPRGGQAVDFFIPGITSYEIAAWIMDNLQFDRLYYYGDDCPIHVSYGPEMKNECYLMKKNKNGDRRMPHRIKNIDKLK
tara:strand:- start:426 stop:965 length:540 start_codon:yes stop_codon:yes gene_type:complete